MVFDRYVQKKLVSGIKNLSWNRVLNTSKISKYLTNHGIQNRVFYMLIKHLSISWYSLIP
jgi:hypothetical protein